jgi:hypothetical protein
MKPISLLPYCPTDLLLLLKNVKLSVCVINQDAMKMYGGGGIAPLFLTSTVDGGEWSASRPCRFTSEKRAPGTLSVEGWVDPRTGLDAVEK